MLSPEIRDRVLGYQKDEVTEYHIYRQLAQAVGEGENRTVLERIAADELRHARTFQGYTGQEVGPDRRKVWWYYWIARVLGLTFGIKLMERGEASAQTQYASLTEFVPEAAAIAHDEDVHETALIGMLDEERLRYTGSMVLGLNDALVELTGALAGFTLALQNARLIALTGTITGIAAAFSMAASEYLSTRSEAGDKDPIKSALYTGSAYLLTVVVLVLPFILLPNYYVSLGLALVSAVLIIAAFNYYIAVAKDEDFRKRFVEMAGVSLGVAALSFLVGFVARALLGVEL